MTILTYLKCSMPNCHNTVGQHSKKLNTNKQVCSAHRMARKHEVDCWKLEQGCANRNGKFGIGRYKFPCVCSHIISPATLDINHIDGNNLNRDASNIEVLCKMCHTMVTLQEGHHLNKNKSNRRRSEGIVNNGLFPTLFQ